MCVLLLLMAKNVSFFSFVLDHASTGKNNFRHKKACVFVTIIILQKRTCNKIIRLSFLS